MLRGDAGWGLTPNRSATELSRPTFGVRPRFRPGRWASFIVVRYDAECDDRCRSCNRGGQRRGLPRERGGADRRRHLVRAARPPKPGGLPLVRLARTPLHSAALTDEVAGPGRGCASGGRVRGRDGDRDRLARLPGLSREPRRPTRQFPRRERSNALRPSTGTAGERRGARSVSRRVPPDYRSHRAKRTRHAPRTVCPLP